MSDKLLRHYNNELAFIRRMASEFATDNPGVAEHLRISQEQIDDPHVSRLIEAFAYLNARTRQKIEDSFPELTDAFLNVLYPHYLTPFPSATIVQCQLDKGQFELTKGHTIPRHSAILTEPIDGEPCRFRSCYPVHLWPITVKEASFYSPVHPAPRTSFNARSKAVLRIRLASFSETVPLSQFEFGPLRFYLNGHMPFMYSLYEMLLNNVVGIAVTDGSENPPVLLPHDAIQPVGFGRDEGLVEYKASSFLGYRLLTEYSIFPQKFLFVDLEGLDQNVLAQAGSASELELYIFCDRESEELQNNVEADTFALGCTPAVNLFKRSAEPRRLTHRQVEYRVVPDDRLPSHFEIYSIDKIMAESQQGEEVEYRPFYSIRHQRDPKDQSKFWYATRRPADYRGGVIDSGTEMFVSVVDLDFDPHASSDWTLHIETTCLNRDLPSRFDFGGGQPRISLANGDPLARLRCITAPTPTRRPDLGDSARWQLISHLTVGHLSLVNSEDGAEALREILRLYNLRNSADFESIIEGLRTVSSRRVVGRVGGSVAGGFCRGIEITLGFAEENYVGRGLFLFASILERFLALYSSINSFTKTVATTNRREAPLRSWPPRAGERVLI